MIGLDTGRNPAAVIGQIDPRGRLNILHSMWGENVGIETFLTTQVLPVIHNRFEAASLHAVVDPAGLQRSQIGEQSVIEAINALGMRAYPASTNHIQPRIRAVEARLDRRDGLLIDAEYNADLIKALRFGYRFARNRARALLELPEKGHPDSDLCDSLQYLCLGAGSKAISNRISTPKYSTGSYSEPVASAWT